EVAVWEFPVNVKTDKQHQETIEKAKEKRKQTGKIILDMNQLPEDPEKDMLEMDIILLEKNKASFFEEIDGKLPNSHRLEEEIKQLRKKLERYEHAWEEIGNLWAWAKEKDHNG